MATVWELTTKAMLGKLTVPDGLGVRFTQQGLVLLIADRNRTPVIGLSW